MPAWQIKPIPSSLIHWCVLCACLQRTIDIFSTETAPHSKTAHKQNDLPTAWNIIFRVWALRVETSGTTSPNSSTICRIQKLTLYCETIGIWCVAMTCSYCVFGLVTLLCVKGSSSKLLVSFSYSKLNLKIKQPLSVCKTTNWLESVNR